MLSGREVYRLFMLYTVSVLASSWVYFTAAEVLASGDASRAPPFSTGAFMAVTSLYLAYGLVERERVLALGSLVALIGAAFLLAVTLYVRYS